jgi:1-pyrroline-5-carboxylate dehydrogenase
MPTQPNGPRAWSSGKFAGAPRRRGATQSTRRSLRPRHDDGVDMGGFEGTERPPAPVNEPVYDYAPGSAERAALLVEVDALRAAEPCELPMVIAGRAVTGSGPSLDVVEPHRTEHVVGTLREASGADVTGAVDAALAAAPAWRAMAFRDRAAIFLRAAELLAGPWRARFAAATMLGQSKSAYQSEIDAVC